MVKGSENTELFEPPVYSDHRVPRRRELAKDIAELVVIVRYGRLENKTGSKERLKLEDRLETVVIELVSVCAATVELIGEGSAN